MFTGIIECIATLESAEGAGSNLYFQFNSPVSDELKIDQSVAHNGVCLTVTACGDGKHQVTAIEETLNRTNLGQLRPGMEVNIERCLRASDRIDGHIVQGHVDTTGICDRVTDRNGSWEFTFSHSVRPEYTTVPKGSVCVNGVSLTVVDSEPGRFTVAIIPYTFEHTNFKSISPGTLVNIEFDILGKYVATHLQRMMPYGSFPSGSKP